MEKLSKVFQTRTVPVVRIVCVGLLLIASVALISCGKEPASSHSTLEYHAIHLDTQQIVSEEFGLVNMSIEILASEVRYQTATFESQVTFEDALRAALRSFMEDGTDLESPLSLIKNNFINTSEEERKAILFDYLNCSTTFLRLVTPDTKAGYPERGESIQKNWVFQLRIASYSDHMQWAIVDRLGKKPTYNYGFN